MAMHRQASEADGTGASTPRPGLPGPIGCLVLAAGAGTRFGGPKQLATLAGRPLLEHALQTAAAAPVDRVVVVLGARAPEIGARVELHGAEALVCERWEQGMSEPLKAGLAALIDRGDPEAVAVLLGDQPLVGPEAVARAIASRRPGRAAAVRATYGGRPGHPVVIERSLFAPIAELRGDAGARELLAAADVVTVACDDVGDDLDVDLPTDLERAERALAAGRG